MEYNLAEDPLPKVLVYMERGNSNATANMIEQPSDANATVAKSTIRADRHGVSEERVGKILEESQEENPHLMITMAPVATETKGVAEDTIGEKPLLRKQPQVQQKASLA